MTSRRVRANLWPGPIVAWPRRELMLEDCLLRRSLLRFGSGCHRQSYHDRLDAGRAICCQTFDDGLRLWLYLNKSTIRILVSKIDSVLRVTEIFRSIQGESRSEEHTSEL